MRALLAGLIGAVMSASSLACDGPPDELRAETRPARERVHVVVVGKVLSMHSYSCQWGLHFAEFVNLSGRSVVVSEIEVTLRHFGKGPKHAGAPYDAPPSVTQTVSVDVELAPFAHQRVNFGESGDSPVGPVGPVSVQGCEVTRAPRVSAAEFVD